MPSELTVQLVGCCTICGMGCLWCVEGPKIYLLVLMRYLRDASAIRRTNAYAFKTGRICTSTSLIRSILGWRCWPNILPTQVIPFGIFVVDLMLWPFSGHHQKRYAMRMKMPLAVNRHRSVAMAERASQLAYKPLPTVRRDLPSQIAGFWIVGKDLARPFCCEFVLARFSRDSGVSHGDPQRSAWRGPSERCKRSGGPSFIAAGAGACHG